MASFRKYRQVEAKLLPLLLLKVVRGQSQIVAKGSQN